MDQTKPFKFLGNTGIHELSVIRHKTNMGVSSARNNAISKSTGDTLCFLIVMITGYLRKLKYSFSYIRVSQSALWHQVGSEKIRKDKNNQ